ncbi:1904_t:CDS:2, partial [Cetraspora pellucida]
RKISNIENTPLAAINLIYRELFETQTEHFRLAVKKKVTIVVSGIRRSLREDLLYSGPNYTSSLVIYRNSEIYLIWQQVLEDQCSLQYGMYQNQDHFALFGLRDSKVQILLANDACTTCTSLQ